MSINNPISSKKSGAIIFVFIATLLSLIVTLLSDRFQEFYDPSDYWSKEIKSLETLKEGYNNKINWYALEIRKIKNNRELYLRQQYQSGYSEEEAWEAYREEHLDALDSFQRYDDKFTWVQNGLEKARAKLAKSIHLITEANNSGQPSNKTIFWIFTSSVLVICILLAVKFASERKIIFNFLMAVFFCVFAAFFFQYAILALIAFLFLSFIKDKIVEIYRSNTPAGRRNEYNKKVVSLLHYFGFNSIDTGAMKIGNGLDIPWYQMYNVREAALYAANLLYSKRIKSSLLSGPIGERRTNMILNSIKSYQKTWLSRGVIRKDLAESLTPESKERINEGQQVSTLEFELSPNMPDIMQRKPISAHTANQYLMLLVEDAPSIGERISESTIPLHYLFAMAVIDKSTKHPIMFVTLETGFTDDIFLCVFEESGVHSNLGDGSAYTESNAFETIAINTICKSLNIDRSIVSKVSG